MNTSRKILLSVFAIVLLVAAYRIAWYTPSMAQAESISFNDADPPKDPLGGPRISEPAADEQEKPRPDDDEMDEPRESRRRGGFRRGGRGRFTEEGKRRFGRPGERRGGMGRGEDDERDPADIEAEVMPILQEKLPDWHDRFSRLKQDDSRKFGRAMRRVFPMVREFKRLREEHPEMAQSIIDEFQLEHELRRKAEAFSQAAEDSPERAALLPEIREMLMQQQRIRLQRHRFRLEMFEKRLDEQRARLQREQQKLARESEGIEVEVARKIEKLKKGEFRDELGPPRRRGGGFGRSLHGPDDDADGPPRRRERLREFRERRRQRDRDEASEDDVIGDE